MPEGDVHGSPLKRAAELKLGNSFTTAEAVAYERASPLKRAGRRPPVICTPVELMEDRDESQA